MRGLVLERLPHRFAAARAATALLGSGKGVGVGPLRLTELDLPALPGPGWMRARPLLAGICGSDLATLDATSSRFFEPIVSFPFVPGHEVLAVAETGPLSGRKVVLEAVLGCEARGIEPRCPPCSAGHKGSCEQIAFGHLRPGLQTGYCADTGGGWSESLVAHSSQLHEVPRTLTDEEAVMVEPTACAIHAALRAHIDRSEHVVVLGSGTLGLATIAAIRHFSPPATLLATAKHPRQRELASALGAELVVAPDELGRAVRRVTGSLALPPLVGLVPRSDTQVGRVGRLAGGADVILDCVGSAGSIEQALAVVRPGGRIVLVGMPGSVRVDLAPLWQREIDLVGAYAYGQEDLSSGPRPTFELAFDLVADARLGRLVTARYPLGRYEEAIRHAATAGRQGAVKIVFDLGDPRGTPR